MTIKNRVCITIFRIVGSICLCLAVAIGVLNCTIALGLSQSTRTGIFAGLGITFLLSGILIAKLSSPAKSFGKSKTNYAQCKENTKGNP